MGVIGDYDTECFPITDLAFLDEVIATPPKWVSMIEPLKPRSNGVIVNVVNDCHVEEANYTVKPRIPAASVPRSLVCHDYKGGYVGDKYVNGSDLGNEYTFYNWAQLDTFVYFSHYFITIPTLAYINAGHRNGVKVLGTLITEGVNGILTCNVIFADDQTMRAFADKLVRLAKIFNFDGWFLNIENNVSQIGTLEAFVLYLTQACHEADDKNLVIWYDSVTVTGYVAYQNELNAQNQLFFDSCDGIFLNYVWNEDKMRNSLANAGSRAADVYVGIDVWGRGQFGGGQYNCYIAAEMIRRYNMSHGVFAPGWTNETLAGTADPAEFFKNYQNNDTTFWNSLWPYLYTHPVPKIFATEFFIGITETRFDMNLQEQQLSNVKFTSDKNIWPVFDQIPTLANKCNCLSCAFPEDTLRLRVTKENLNPATVYVHRLFSADIQLVGTVLVYFLWKQVEESDPAYFGLNLLFSDASGGIRKVKCLGSPKAELKNSSVLQEVNRTASSAALKRVLTKHAAFLEDEDVMITIYRFTTGPTTLQEIGGVLEQGTSIYIYGFGIENY